MQHDRPDIVAIDVEEKFLESEQKRIVEAIDRTTSYLKGIKSKIPSSAPREIEAFIDTHLQMVNDDDLIYHSINIINHIQVRRNLYVHAIVATR